MNGSRPPVSSLDWYAFESKWREGVRLFNAGLYWESHEAWEWNWRTLPEAERTWLQAQIQVAAVLVHLRNRRPDPALRLAALARQKLLRGAPDRTLIPLRVVISEADAFLAGLLSVQALQPDQLESWVAAGRARLKAELFSSK